MSLIRPRVAVVYYSLYGHVHQLALKQAEGARAAGADVSLYRIKETMSNDVLAAMKAPAPPADIPEANVNDLPKYDAFLFGSPTRFGSPAAQYKSFWDQTGGLWAKGALNGKLAGFFTSTNCQGSGQETTALTQLGHFVHHGMLYVPLGFGNPELQDMTEIHGGSPWCAGTFAAGNRQVSTKELGLAFYQGKRTAEFAKLMTQNKQQQ